MIAALVLAAATATGHFDVTLTPVPGSPVTALTMRKSFHGDLEATGVGELLAVTGAVEGSAGYVAMERVTGALAGRQGSFALQHRGVMTRGRPSLLVTVVPDSGTGALVGLSGTMDIDAAKNHAYTFRYTLPER